MSFKNKKNIIPFSIGALLILILLISVYFVSLNKMEFNSLKKAEASDIDKSENKNHETPEVIEKEYTITSLGNLIVHSSQIDGAKINNTFNFEKSFQYIKPLLEKDTASIGIIEGSFAGGTPSGYPLFNIPDEFLTSVKNSGLDIVTFATNHSIDKGVSGFKRGLDKITEANLKYTGARSNLNSPKYTILDIDGHKVGFFAYTFRTDANNGNSINSIPIPSELSPLINSFNYNNIPQFDSEVKQIVSSMQNENVEFIISSIHWGMEYTTTPNNSQKEIAKMLNSNGIDVILGGHPHVIQPYETLTNKSGKNTLVFYSQGNTLSNQCTEEIGKPLSEDGLIVTLTLGLKNNKLYLKSYDVIPTWVYREKNPNGTLTHRIIPVLDAINSPDNFNLDTASLNRVKRSLSDTKTIVGESKLGVQQIK